MYNLMEESKYTPNILKEYNKIMSQLSVQKNSGKQCGRTRTQEIENNR